MNNIRIKSTDDNEGYMGEHYCMTREECRLFIETGWEERNLNLWKYRRVIRKSYDE